MNKSLRNGLIFFALLIAAFIISQYKQSKLTTVSEAIFAGQTEDIQKILIQKGGDAIELVKAIDTWKISGNDTLVMRQDRIDNLFNKVLTVDKETLLSKNPEKWHKYSIDDSLGTHLGLIDYGGETVSYYVFGRSTTDWSHNYVRIKDEPEVWLTSSSVIHHLSTKATHWGEKPKPDSTGFMIPDSLTDDNPGISSVPNDVTIKHPADTSSMQTLELPVEIAPDSTGEK